MSTKVAVVIVGYFSSDDLTKLIPQLSLQGNSESLSMTITCIDNSVDASERNKLTSLVKIANVKIRLIFSPTNIGFGAAINIATFEAEFDYLWLVNPDVSLYRDTLKRLIDVANANPPQGIWGAVTLNENNRPDLRHAWRQPSLLNTFSWAFAVTRAVNASGFQDNYKIQLSNPKSPYPVDVVSGSCMLISQEAWQQLKGFDEDFFLYSEEVDLCTRARDLGFQPHVVPTAKLKHHVHSEEISRERRNLVFRAKVLMIKKHHRALYTWAYSALLASGSLLRSILYLIRTDTVSSKAWLSTCIAVLKSKN